jgi:FkbM family methyltransferase
MMILLEKQSGIQNKMSNPAAEKLRVAFDTVNPVSCLDIGANTGQFATEWRKIFPECKITSIEPNPNCEKGLKKIGVEYFQYGISDKVGELELILPKAKSNSKGASFYKEINFNKLSEEEILKIKVPVTTLDALFPNAIFDVIKIDVQGAELDVINGGISTLSKSSYIIVEVSLVPYNEGAPLADVIVRRMEDFKFFVQDIVNMHIDKFGNTIQLDLLFSKIDAHRMSAITDFKKELGL